MARRLGPAAITLIVIDAILVVALIVLIATMPDGPDDGSSPSTEQTTSAGTDPTGEESTSAAAAVEPPEDALDLAEFAAPSTNIWCTLTESSATCQIAVIDRPPSVADCADNDLAGHVFTVSADGASIPCPDGDIPGADAGDRDVLEYGETTAVGDSMCVSANTGVTCTNLTTGASFSLARGGTNLTNT